MTAAVQAILIALGGYLSVGVAFGVAFLVRGIAVVDPVAAGSSWRFRLVVLPGVAALWPLLALRWRRASRGQGHTR